MLQAGMAFSATAALTMPYFSTSTEASAGWSLTKAAEEAYSSMNRATAWGCWSRNSLRTSSTAVMSWLSPPRAFHCSVRSRATRRPSTWPMATTTKGWGSMATALSWAAIWATISVGSLFHSTFTSLPSSRPFRASR